VDLVETAEQGASVVLAVQEAWVNTAVVAAVR
jgi:hypothetical protein